MDESVIPKVFRDLAWHNENHSSAKVKFEVDKIMTCIDGPIESMLVLDADRTLTAEDTGKLFWELYGSGPYPLDAIFKSSVIPPTHMTSGCRMSTFRPSINFRKP